MNWNPTAGQVVIAIIAVIVLLWLVNWWRSSPKGEQMSLNPKQMEAPSPATAKPSYRFMAFYAAWCGASQAFLKDWKEVEAALNQLGVQANLIDAEANSDLANYYNIIRYPTLILVTPQKNIEYMGPRDAQTIARFVKQNM